MRVISLILFAFLPAAASAQQIVELWPDQAPPFSKEAEDREFVDPDCWGNVPCARFVSTPTLTLFPARKPSKTWLLIMPGGGYESVAIEHEGSEIAEAFVKRGYSAAVLKYRIPDSRTSDHPEKVPFADFRRAMAMLRAEQENAGVVDGQIGIIGFSASGHLSVFSMVHPDPEPDLNADFAILVYGVSDLNDENRKWLEDSLYYRPLTEEEVQRETLLDHVTPATPPAFLVHALDDEICRPTESTLYADALRENGVIHDINLFEKGGHGFGLGRASDGTNRWLKLAVTFIKHLPSKSAQAATP